MIGWSESTVQLIRPADWSIGRDHTAAAADDDFSSDNGCDFDADSGGEGDNDDVGDGASISDSGGDFDGGDSGLGDNLDVDDGGNDVNRSYKQHAADLEWQQNLMFLGLKKRKRPLLLIESGN